MPRWRWIAVSLGAPLLAAAAILHGPSEAVAKRSSISYLGQASAGSASKIRLDVAMRSGRPQSATFDARNINLTCEDGTSRDWVSPFDPIKLGFHGSRRTFDGRRYEQAQPAASEIVMRIHGRLLSGGRAEGYLLVYVNPYDYPDQANDPECTSTGGQQPWSAERE